MGLRYESCIRIISVMLLPVKTYSLLQIIHKMASMSWELIIIMDEDSNEEIIKMHK